MGEGLPPCLVVQAEQPERLRYDLGHPFVGLSSQPQQEACALCAAPPGRISRLDRIAANDVAQAELPLGGADRLLEYRTVPWARDRWRSARRRAKSGGEWRQRLPSVGREAQGIDREVASVRPAFQDTQREARARLPPPPGMLGDRAIALDRQRTAVDSLRRPKPRLLRIHDVVRGEKPRRLGLRPRHAVRE